MGHLTCPHGREIVGKDVYGIFSHYHTDDNSGCDVLNVIGFSVQQVLPFYATRLKDTPEFRAAFLVSRKMRKDVYRVLSGLDAKTLVAALHLLYKVVKSAAYEAAIWDECYETFGAVFVSNIRMTVGFDIAFSRSPENSVFLPMIDLQTKQVADARTEGQRTIDAWKRQAEQAASEAANNKSWKR